MVATKRRARVPSYGDKTFDNNHFYPWTIDGGALIVVATTKRRHPRMVLLDYLFSIKSSFTSA